jgi:hypothetical protein
MRRLSVLVLSLVILSFPGCGNQTEPLELTGTFTSVAGEEGVVGFGESFVGQPNVELRSRGSAGSCGIQAGHLNVASGGSVGSD